MATSNEAMQRATLLQAIYTMFIQPHPAITILYPGAGADFYNPHACTHATEYIFIDNDMKPESLKTNMLEVLGPSTTITVASDGSLKAGAITIHLKNMNYNDFVQGMGNIQYDVLFDKDSWLKESGKDVVVSMVEHLKDGGYWITNTNLGGAWVSNLLAAAGLQEVTAQLGPINLTFGFSAVKIYCKQHFDKVAFGAVYEFCDSIFTICNTLDRHERVTHSDIEDFYKDHLESAPNVLNAFPNLKIIAQQICNTILIEMKKVAK